MATAKTRLEDLTNQWQEAKAAERAATERRLLIENQIIDIVGSELPIKGTSNFGALKIVSGVTEKWDQDAITRASVRWPNKRFPFPFRQEWKPNNDDLRTMGDNFPDLWERLEDAVTVEPRKPTFEVKGVSTQRDLKSR